MKHIAMFMPGGVGDVNTPFHIPALVNLVTRLSNDFDITIYSVIKPDGKRENFYCGQALVKYINARYNDHVFKRLFYLFKNLIRDHRNNPYDFVHGFWAFPFGFAAVILGKLFHIPSIVSLQGAEAAALRDIQYGFMHKPLLRSLTLWSIHHAGGVTALSRFQIDQIKKYGMKRDDCRIIPFGTPKNFFGQTNNKHIHHPLRLLHVAHINKVKDQTTLIQAFKIIREHIYAELKFIGEDLMNGALQKLVHDYELEKCVEFLGYVQHEKLNEYYEWADILLHTSLYESQGVVISEALAHGVVVCGTNVGLLSDLSGTAAITVDVRDYKALASKVMELVNDSKLYERLQKNGYEYAHTYDADWTANEFKKLYEEITGR